MLDAVALERCPLPTRCTVRGTGRAGRNHVREGADHPNAHLR